MDSKRTVDMIDRLHWIEKSWQGCELAREESGLSLPSEERIGDRPAWLASLARASVPGAVASNLYHAASKQPSGAKGFRYDIDTLEHRQRNPSSSFFRSSVVAVALIQASFLALFALFFSFAFAVSPIVVQGSDFVNSVDGSQFQIIGVAYQPGGSSGFDPSSGVDALTNATVCMRDAALLQRLGVNAIRVYNLDPDLNHQECASIFNAAGIYMILDVNSPLPNQSLNRGEPWTTYNYDYLNRVFQIVEAFMHFPNTLGFFSGNEVINEDSVSQVPSYIRAVTRDLKDYIAARAPRTIPVGYSAAAVDSLLMSTFDYLSCGLSNDTSSKIDFFGLNTYAWCGGATFETSGYNVIVSEFSSTTVPIFFSEYGCNVPSPRVFDEVSALYGPQMIDVMSGGLVYEYSEEPNNYGLVNISDDGSVSILQDYDNLQTQYNGLNLKELTSSNSTATSLTPPQCSSGMVTIGNFDNTFELPSRPGGVDDLINNGVANANTYPQGTSDVKTTTITTPIFDVNGQQLTGLELKVLQSDQSNLPGGNTSGTSGNGSSTTSTTGSAPTATSSNAAVRVGDMKMGSLVMGGLTLGFLAQL